MKNKIIRNKDKHSISMPVLMPTFLKIRNYKTLKTLPSDEIFSYFLTIDPESVNVYVVDAVNNKFDNRICIIQNAIKNGFNINNMELNKKIVRLIEIAIKMNDLELFIFCLKENADIKGGSLLHLSIRSKNAFAIKYFCRCAMPGPESRNKIDVNKLDEMYLTPLDIACCLLDIETVDLLLQAGAINITDGVHFLIKMLIGKLSHKECSSNIDPNDDNNHIIASNILKKIISLRIVNFEILVEYSMRFMITNNIEILKSIIDFYPEILKHRYENNNNSSFLSISILVNYLDLTIYILDKISKQDLMDEKTCLYEACNTGNVEMVKVILQKGKGLTLTQNNDNIFVHNFVSKDISYNASCFIKPRSCGDVTEIVKLLIEANYDINDNSDNNEHMKPLHSAIINWDSLMISRLIDMGLNFLPKQMKQCMDCGSMFNINEQKTDIGKIWNHNINDDYISLAVQCDKLDIVKLLIEKKSSMFYVEIDDELNKYNKLKVYTSMIFAVVYVRTDILQYLLQIREIEDNVKKYLFRVATSFACCDDQILRLLSSDFQSLDEHCTDTYIDTTYFELYFEGYLEMTNEMKNKTLTISSMFTNIFCYVVDLCNKYDDKHIFCRVESSGKYSKYINALFSQIDDMLDFIEDSMYENIISPQFKIMHVRTNISHALLHTMFYRIMHIYHNYHNLKLFKLRNQSGNHLDSETKKAIDWDTDEIETSCEIVHFVKLLVNEKKKASELKKYRDYVEKICMTHSSKSSKNIFSHEIKEIYDEMIEENEENEIIFNGKNNKTHYSYRLMNNDEIKHMLRKLSNPVKVPHYYYMYTLLLNRVMININPKCIYSSIDHTEYYAIKIKSKKPEHWFSYYGKNIGKDGKTDKFHMFPMQFDQILKTYPCITRTSENSESDDYNIIMYFYGKMIDLDQSETIYGCYEYIINSRGTLFHRFFKSMNKIPEDVVKDILKRSKYE